MESAVLFAERRREVHRLIPLVQAHLRRVGVGDTIEVVPSEWDPQPPFDESAETGRRVPIDLLLQYPHALEQDRKHVNMLLGQLDRASGAYMELEQQALDRRHSPAAWIAYVVRFPLSVLELSGLVDDETHGALAKVYLWALRLLVLLLLVLLAAKLGVSLPWGTILKG